MTVGARKNELRYRPEWGCASCGAHLHERVDLCPSCLRPGTIVQRYQRRAERDAPRRGGMTARQLAASDLRSRPLRPYGLRVARNSLVFVHGAAGSGKSTMALRICDEMTPSLYVATEMGLGPALADLLQRMELRSDDVRLVEPRSVGELYDEARSDDYQVVAIDSVSPTSLLPEDCLNMARGLDVIVLAIAQQTKAGSHRGSEEWAHDADVVVRVEDMAWEATKSRYQPVDDLRGRVR